MRLLAKALLKGKKVFEPIVDHLYLARVKIIEPADYNSPSSDYSYVEAEATATGSKYIYVYVLDNLRALFEEKITDSDSRIVVKSNSASMPIQQYNSSAGRFAIGNLTSTPSDTYLVSVYDAKENTNIFEIKLKWTNNYL